MRLRILHVPECPNSGLLLTRLRHCLSETEAARVELVLVDDQDQAIELGMTGSPTLLVDGVDPFATAGAEPSLSCRLFLDGHGALPDRGAAVCRADRDRGRGDRRPRRCPRL